MARKRKSRRSPGEGSVYLRNDTARYQASIVVGWTPKGNARRVSRSFDTRGEALAWLGEQQAALGRGAQLDSSATLQQVFDAWHRAGRTLGGWSPNTAASYRYILTKHVLAKLGHVRVRDLSPSDVRTLLSDMIDAGRSLSLVRRVRSYLSILMIDAQRMRYIQVNPVDGVKLPVAPDPTIERWSEDEVAAVVRECLQRDGQVANYVLAALGTGLRTEELLGLTWRDVDLEEQVVTVRQVAPPGGSKRLEAGGKTDAATRAVPVDGITVAAFRRQRELVERLKAMRVHLNAKLERRRRPPLPWREHDLVFCTSVGTILDRKTLRREFDAIQAAAGVTRIRLYATRSTHGSLLADEGVNLHALAERLGHTDPRFTAKVYLRGSNAAHRAVADRVGRILEAGARSMSVADDTQNPVKRAPRGASANAATSLESTKAPD